MSNNDLDTIQITKSVAMNLAEYATCYILDRKMYILGYTKFLTDVFDNHVSSGLSSEQAKQATILEHNNFLKVIEFINMVQTCCKVNINESVLSTSDDLIDVQDYIEYYNKWDVYIENRNK